jgi:hypothetical protein
MRITTNIEAELFKEITTSQDRILDEAKAIVNKAEQADFDKILALIDAGFPNCAEVKEYREKQKAELLLHFMNYYAAVYPLNRFITEAEIKRICEKYALYLAWTDDYIDAIPQKNVGEILRFRIREKDMRLYEDGYRWAPSDSEMLKHLQRQIDSYEAGERPDRRCPDLRIAAPEHKLNMDGKIKYGHILIEDDPIVLAPVPLGFLIVSQWGLEAGDPLVVNAINN